MVKSRQMVKQNQMANSEQWLILAQWLIVSRIVPFALNCLKSIKSVQKSIDNSLKQNSLVLFVLNLNKVK